MIGEKLLANALGPTVERSMCIVRRQLLRNETAFPVRVAQRVVIRWVLLARSLWTEGSPVEERKFAGDPGRNLGQILLGWTLASLCLLSGGAWAQVVTEFSTGITGGARPYNITAGPYGNLWFT